MVNPHFYRNCRCLCFLSTLQWLAGCCRKEGKELMVKAVTYVIQSCSFPEKWKVQCLNRGRIKQQDKELNGRNVKSPRLLFSSPHKVVNLKKVHTRTSPRLFLSICFYLEYFCVSLDLFLLGPSATQACMPELICFWKTLVFRCSAAKQRGCLNLACSEVNRVH